MYIPLNVTTHDKNDSNVYERLVTEVNDILAMINETHIRLNNGETIPNLDNGLADEIRNLDTTQVTIELTRNDAGNLWLHLWNK